MFSNIWNKLKGRRAQKAPRTAPLCQGHEETLRLTATNAAVDVDRLQRAIQRAGGVVVTVSDGGKQEKGKEPLAPASNQQVGSTVAQPQAPPPEEEEGESFPKFPDFVSELRCMIWKEAINDPRLIYIHFGIPGARTPTRFDRCILNRNHLAETRNPRRSVFNTCCEGRGECRRTARPDSDHSRYRWFRLLGLGRLKPTRSDLVYVGGLQGQGRVPPADTSRIIPLALALGDVLPWVMVNADIFVNYFNPDPSRQPENPMDKALADLRALPTLGSGNLHMFADNAQHGLPHPQLPETMVFMLDNFRLKWEIASPCTVPGHNEDPETSCCIHHDHLEIIADEKMDDWMDENLGQYDDRASFRIRMEIVPAIRAIFAGWQSLPGVATQVPQLSFARIRPSE